MRRRFVTGCVSLVLLLTGGTAASASAESVTFVNPQEFLQMSSHDRVSYASGVLDGLLALVADRTLPREKVLCARPTPVTLGEVIGTAEAYLYKTLASDMKEKVKIMPAALWLVRAYWALCAEAQ